jgi:hypothetical protein
MSKLNEDMATAMCPNPECRATLGGGKVQLVGIGVTPMADMLYAVICKACGVTLGVVSDRSSSH